MKRSKMVSKIASVILNYNEPNLYIKREKALEITETILKIQEESGMHPSWYEKSYTDHLGCLRKEYKTGWEPEDE